MKGPNTLLFISFFAFFVLDASAQSNQTENTLSLDSPENTPKADIQDLSWMVGRWEGKGFGGIVEESWNPAIGGTMVGSFRLVKDEAPVFYELLVIVPEGESLAYKVKHFNPDLTGWEEKEESVSFPLIRLEKDTAYFDGLTIIRNGDQLKHYLVFEDKNGKKQETSLTYSRQTPK